MPGFPRLRTALLPILVAVGCLAIIAMAHGAAAACSDPIDAPAAVQVGDRLFRETRFAQFFFDFITQASKRDVNTILKPGDPVLKSEQNAAGKPLRDPFRNQSMNCRNCHLGNDLLGGSRLEGRTYCDFARHSPVPLRSDGLATTPRNAQSLVSVTLPREVPTLFHFDGEFASIADLTLATMTGRNFGWLPSEFAQAQAHIINVIKNDNGRNALARRYGCGGFPYSVVLLGTDPRLPKGLVLPTQYRIDVTSASDDAIMQDVAALMLAYLNSIAFNLSEPPSPYDVFLSKNGLPSTPGPGESNLAYAQRLLGLINQLGTPRFVTPKDGALKLFKQKFQFGASELQGLKVFFTQPNAPTSGGAGNCITCHTPPAFTDNSFHNTGVAQLEYDGIFGPGQFAALTVPDLGTRTANFDAYLPPTPNHPNASGRFRSPASPNNPGFTDLGVWNIFANPDIPNPQTALTQILCAEFNLSGGSCTPEAVLPMAVAFFKTPSVRDPGQSNPYLHNGSLDTIGEVLNFYATVAPMARDGELRNPSPELANVSIDANDIAPLTAFLNALNEDYR
jgi:cytochrome c peroxidase